MGGRRVVRVRGAGNDLADLFEQFLDDPPGDALVVVEGGRSRQDPAALRKLFEQQRQGRRHRLLCRHRARPGRCGARRAARRRLLDRARCAGRCGVAAGLGPRRDAARAGKADALCRGPEKHQPWMMSRRDGRRGRSPQRKKPPTRQAAAIFARLDLALERLWTADTSPSPGAARRHGPFPAPDSGQAKISDGAKVWTWR